MVIERRLIAGLVDIKTLIFACNHCDTRIMVSPTKPHPNSLARCPDCGKDWIAQPSLGKRDAIRGEAPSYDFLDLLPEVIAEQGRKTAGCRILFEFEEPNG